MEPYVYKDGYASIDQYQYNDKEPIGVNLVFEHPQPVVGGRQWILNPDLVVALGLIKEAIELGKAKSKTSLSLHVKCSTTTTNIP